MATAAVGSAPETCPMRLTSESIEGRSWWSSVRSVLSVLCCKNRQHSAGTRRVHQVGHARACADTQDTGGRLDLQEKLARECPAVYARTAWDGKEGVDGSSPSEGFERFLLISPF